MPEVRLQQPQKQKKAEDRPEQGFPPKQSPPMRFEPSQQLFRLQGEEQGGSASQQHTGDYQAAAKRDPTHCGRPPGESAERQQPP
jgi:hypothetical protein